MRTVSNILHIGVSIAQCSRNSAHFHVWFLFQNRNPRHRDDQTPGADAIVLWRWVCFDSLSVVKVFLSTNSCVCVVLQLFLNFRPSSAPQAEPQAVPQSGLQAVPQAVLQAAPQAEQPAVPPAVQQAAHPPQEARYVLNPCLLQSCCNRFF